MNKKQKAIDMLCNSRELWEMRQKWDNEDIASCEKVELYNIAIAALEKQIPKKIVNRQVFRKYNGFKHDLKGDCPSCGCKNLRASETDYCRACGQRIDYEK